jgi:hypothetical protein
VSRLKHENVVELIGYCLDGSLRVLAYEFATMGSLHDILHGKSPFLVTNCQNFDGFAFATFYLRVYEMSPMCIWTQNITSRGANL